MPVTVRLAPFSPLSVTIFSGRHPHSLTRHLPCFESPRSSSVASPKHKQMFTIF